MTAVFRVETDVMVPMRDGTGLATDLWIPEAGPCPTLLVRVPYGKDTFPNLPLMPSIRSLVDAGYAVAWQDCRGTGKSQGDFEPHVDDPHDGADAIAWLREQAWCDGTIGAYGPSYLGFVQWASASQNTPGLRALAPATTSSDFYLAPWYGAGGALSWHNTWQWPTMQVLVQAPRELEAGSADLDDLTAALSMMTDPTPHLDRLPLADQPLLQKRWPWWKEWIGHPSRDELWKTFSLVDKAEQITAPALNIGGWFDIFVDSTAKTFTHMRAHAASPEARDGQRLIIGPWDHMNQEGVYHDRQFGPMASAVASDLTGAHLRFFDRHVRGNEEALAGDAPVRIFVMGIDEWRDEQDWPLPDTVLTDVFLLSGGNANTAGGDGVLSTSLPPSEGNDSYRYDPANPTPSLGGRVMAPSILNLVGPVDQRFVEEREDVLCFTGDVLEDPIEVTGHVSLVLFASTSSRDTDFTGKLVDVFPDGRAIYLTDGILRARYHRSLAEPELLEPERVYELRIDLGVTSNVFLPGHRIRLEVSSSCFPRFDRNTNTGNEIAFDALEDAKIADNRIHHGPNRPSRLVLPVIQRKPS